MEVWELSWRLPLPGATAEELLHGLVVRDLMHGSSYDVDVESTGATLAVDLAVGDELEDSSYVLLVTAEVVGSMRDTEALAQLFEEIVDELLEEADELVTGAEELASIPANELVMERVAEDQERWDLLIPDWLAPDGAEVPFGFRPRQRGSDDHWPDDATIAAHGRVVVVPDGASYRLFAIPAASAARPSLTVLDNDP